jgi:hypothetical protein
VEGKLREALRVELAAVQAPGGAAAVEAVSAAEAEARLARAEVEAAAAERTETLQRVERPLQPRRQLQAAVASLQELTWQAPPAEGPGSSRDRNGLLAPLY